MHKTLLAFAFTILFVVHDTTSLRASYMRVINTLKVNSMAPVAFVDGFQRVFLVKLNLSEVSS